MTRRMNYASWFCLSIICLNFVTLATAQTTKNSTYDAATLETFKRSATSAGKNVGTVAGSLAAISAAQNVSAGIGTQYGLADGKTAGTQATRDVILNSMAEFGNLLDTHHKAIDSITKHFETEGERRAQKATVKTGTQVALNAASGVVEDTIRDFYSKYEADTAAAVAAAVDAALKQRMEALNTQNTILKTKVQDVVSNAARQASIERSEFSAKLAFNETIDATVEQATAAAHTRINTVGPKASQDAQEDLKKKADASAYRISQEELVKLLENEATRKTREQKMTDLAADTAAKRAVEKFTQNFIPQINEQYKREGAEFGRQAVNRIAEQLASTVVTQAEPVIQQTVEVSATKSLEENVPKVENVMQPLLAKRSSHVLQVADAVGAGVGKITGTEVAIDTAAREAITLTQSRVDTMKNEVDNEVRIAAMKTARKWEDTLGRLPSRTKKQADQLATQSGIRRGVAIATQSGSAAGTKESKRLSDDIRNQLATRLSQQLDAYKLKYTADLNDEQTKEKTTAVNIAQTSATDVARKTAKDSANNQARITSMNNVRDWANSATDDIVTAATNAATQAVHELASLSVQDINSKKSQVENEMDSELNRLVTLVSATRGSERARILAKKAASSVAQQLLGNYTIALTQIVNQVASSEGSKAGSNAAEEQSNSLMQQWQNDMARSSSAATSARVYDILAPWVFKEQELANEVRTDRKKSRSLHTAATILLRLIENSDNLNSAVSLGSDAGQRIGYDKGGLIAKSTVITKYVGPDGEQLRKVFATIINSLTTEIRVRKAKQRQMVYRLTQVRNSYDTSLIEIKADARKYVADVETQVRDVIQTQVTRLLKEIRTQFGDNSAKFTDIVNALVPRDAYETKIIIEEQRATAAAVAAKAAAAAPAPVAPAPVAAPVATTTTVAATNGTATATNGTAAAVATAAAGNATTTATAATAANTTTVAAATANTNGTATVSTSASNSTATVRTNTTATATTSTTATNSTATSTTTAGTTSTTSGSTTTATSGSSTTTATSGSTTTTAGSTSGTTTTTTTTSTATPSTTTTTTSGSTTTAASGTTSTTTTTKP